MTEILSGPLDVSAQGPAPPQALEAERAVLAALMFDHEIVGRAVEQMDSSAFYRTAHQKIFDAVVALYGRNEKADIVTLAEELRKRGDLELVGGPPALAQIAEYGVTTANLDQHIRIVREKAVLRSLIVASREIQQEAFAAQGETEEILDRAEQRIFEITDDRIRQGFVSMKELMMPTVKHVEDLIERNRGEKVFLTGVPSGYEEIDAKTAGFQRGDLIIIAGRPSMGKCLARNSELVLDDGSVVTIEELVRRRDSRIGTLRRDFKLGRARPSDYVDDGRKPVFEVTTRLGRRVETTLPHPFLTLEGWKPLGELSPGDYVAVPRALPVFGDRPMRECEVKLLAARKNAPNPLIRWLRDLGLAGKNSAAKTIPGVVFRLPRPQLAMFLSHLFATDGWACVLASGQPQLGYSSVSEQLARQVTHLLLRFGVIAKLRRRMVRYRGTRRPSWQVDITDSPSIRRFLDEIGIFGKEEAVERVRAALESRRVQTNVDLVPLGVWSLLERAKGDLSWPELARRAGVTASNIHVGRRALSRGRLARFALALGDAQLLTLANSDVTWDRIESIVPTGRRQVYDLTMPGTHNFVANDICVHNSSFATNIAEHASIRFGHPVAILSLEMSKEQLALRLLCSQTEVPLWRVRSGNLSQAEYQKLTRYAGPLYKAPIMIDDTASPSVLEIRAKCRRLKSEGRLDLVIVDYLQLIRAGGKSENRVQEISLISRSLKALAKELDVPVIALSQLSRAVEQRTGKDRRPQLSDLRESGALEQDADLVMFVFREEMYKRDDPSVRGKAEILISKQRNGPTGDVPLTFLHEYTKFVKYREVMEGETQPDAPPDDFSPF